MANAKKDDNNVPTLTAALNTNGTTVVLVKVGASNHALSISDGTTGSNNGPTNDLRDDNFVPCWMGVSSADGTTPVVCYANSAGALLIDSS